MKYKSLITAGILLTCTFILPGNLKAQNCDPISRSKLKEMLVQLGHTVKDLETAPGKEKYEITITRDGFDVPVAYEISGSNNYIWLTVFLGKPPSGSDILNASLLKQNFKIQPCLFYITNKGNLLMGLPVDNRGINNALLRRYNEFIPARVVETKSFWENL